MLVQIHKGVARAQGSRPYQEDQFTTIDHVFSQSGFALYGVFDGHGGAAASKHAANTLPNLILNSEAFKRGDYATALREAFLEEDKLLWETFKEEGRKKGGSTATVALVVNGQDMYVANVGDSNAMVARKLDGGKNYKAIMMTKEHKVDDTKESQRLNNTNAEIRGERVVASGHAINMTRALGDFDFKAPINGEQNDWISPVPHISKTTLTRDDDFAIVASDGLWNAIETETLVPVVVDMRKNGESPQRICENLVGRLGKMRGSDNVTCVMLDFGWSEE
ncbi:phosphatase 2C-like domain-containing protein [Gaertneriomyces semiglobifer]|nr:phosphatase 2C-like domain-containing protein [Gaertneriomyces semiglobifer]